MYESDSRFSVDYSGQCVLKTINSNLLPSNEFWKFTGLKTQWKSQTKFESAYERNKCRENEYYAVLDKFTHENDKQNTRHLINLHSNTKSSSKFIQRKFSYGILQTDFWSGLDALNSNSNKRPPKTINWRKMSLQLMHLLFNCYEYWFILPDEGYLILWSMRCDDCLLVLE